MDLGETDAATAQLLREHAEREWLRGEAIHALAAVDQIDRGRYRVRGLTGDGAPQPSLDERVMDFFSPLTEDRDIFTAVVGSDPDCVAVSAYRAAGYDRTWLAITPGRVAILRLRDVQNTNEGLTDELLAQAKQSRSAGSLLRGVGKLMKSTAVEMARSVRRPPLSERPEDAVLECPFEIPYGHLHSITRWKQPRMPTFSGGPRFVHVQFADDSWARFTTNEPGATTLTGPTDHR